MYSKFVKFCSVILTVALLINLLPAQVLGEEVEALLTQSETVSSNNVVDDNELDISSNATILGEVVDKRTEFSKEFRLSNGMNMIVVYPEAVHFEKDNAWEEIDNTLVTDNSRGIGTYRNKNNSWNVSLPQQLSATNKITVEKNGYVVSFTMAGEKWQYPTTISTEKEIFTMTSDNILVGTETVQTTSAQVVELNFEEAKRLSAHPETVADTLQSRLRYSNVYQNTDVQYDLNSYQLKESIILRSYNAAVRGYDFLLETGGLIPVLQEDNSIVLQTAQAEDIMTLPAPYMIDSKGAISRDVSVTLSPSTGGYLLNYQMPMDWLADAKRAWPVVLDPIIVFDHYRQNIKDQFVAEYYYEDYNHGAMYCGYNQSYGRMRSFLKYVNIPDLTSADVVVHAELSLYRLGGSVSLLPVEVHKVEGDWDSQDITWNTQPAYNPIIEDYCKVGNTGSYSWVITDIVKEWYKEGNLEDNKGLMLKAPDSVENGTTNFWKKFYTIDYDVTEPAICPHVYIYIKNSNGLESYWDYTTTSAGRAGTGYVNNYSGNLTWIRNDIGFGGNRMPVTISHVYNTNDITDEIEDVFGMGYGWRTNFNQTVYQWGNNNTTYYVWEDGDGTKHYFKADTNGVFKDEDGLGLEMTISDNAVTIEDKDGNTSSFSLYKVIYDEDLKTNLSYFRLHTLTNNQETSSSITVAYSDSSSLFMSQITDGAGRVYIFTYTNDLLSRISYFGKVESELSEDDTEISYVTFEYDGFNLTSVTDKDGESSLYTYSGNYLTSVQDLDGYKLVYGYLGGIPKRVGSITEWDEAEGGTLTFKYAHNQTTLKEYTDSPTIPKNVQILQFNDWGNLIAIQDDQGRAQYMQYNRNTYKIEDNSKANQMSLSSKMQNTVSNLLLNSSFEQDSAWSTSYSSVTVSRSTEAAYLGSHSLKVVGTEMSARKGAYSQAYTVGPGETITFSAYVKTVDAAATLGIERQSDYSGFDSEVVAEGKDWERYQVSYTNNSAVSEIVNCCIYVRDPGAVYLDCVQAEYAPTASRYNIIENGDFRYGTNSWIMSNYCDSNEIPVTFTDSAAPQLNATAFQIVGDPNNKLRIRQEVPISGAAGDTFVLAGWAKGEGVPLLDRADGNHRTFTVRGTFMSLEGDPEEFNFDFNPDTDGQYWQYCAGVMVATKPYSGIKIQVLYDYGANAVHFDGIQLFKENFGTSYTYNANGDIEAVEDIQGQTTTYEYYTGTSNIEKIMQGEEVKASYVYDTHNNVTQATVQMGEDSSSGYITYNFTYDVYGNNTSVNIGGATGITTTATYTHEGNHLHTTKDELENVTTYCYNEDTSVLEWVQYPNDTESSRTTYTYDSMYRLASASAAVPGLSEGTALTASYTYEDDLLTKIQTGSTTYSFTYGAFAQRTGVGIGDRTLASYSYTDDLNRYLDKLTYGNGDYTEYDYDNQGRLTLETFEDNNTVSYIYDNTGALSTMTDSATGRTTTYYYDLIDRLGKYVEKGTGFEHSVSYTYDTPNDKITTVETINGVERTTIYIYDYENRIASVETGGISRNYSYDCYGRLFEVEDTYSSGHQPLITYYYHDTAERLSTQINAMRIDYESGITVNYSYTYDNNRNILSVGDGTNTTSYVYDTANQLIRENNQGAGKTWTWTYDNAGNITSRKEYAYTTGDLGAPIDTVPYAYNDSYWGDLLTAYDSTAITYDTIGNPLNDGTWTYTWRNGRELASMSNGSTTWTYTYDANGMRTSRSNGSKTYNYVYNGSQLTQMTVGSNTLNFTYDAGGIPMMVTYNGTNYYYIVNLQGDVMGIMDGAGNVVVNYTYDAWGNPLSITGSMADTLGVQNPLRYRSYVYDAETGYYYLQSRYYDPEIGRFINADSLVTTGQGLLGNNMFAYCRNNPIKRKDVSGTEDVCVTDGEDDNPLNDVYYGSGGGTIGGDASCASIDKPNVSPDASSNTAPTQLDKRFTPDQQAVIELAKENKNGLSLSEAEILVGWAKEYGIKNHGPMIHSGRSGIWGHTLHIGIMKYHIAVY